MLGITISLIKFVMDLGLILTIRGRMLLKEVLKFHNYPDKETAHTRRTPEAMPETHIYQPSSIKRILIWPNIKPRQMHIRASQMGKLSSFQRPMGEVNRSTEKIYLNF